MKEKNFILGVGCQKGGTSWLYTQLQKSKHVNMGFCKEYHIFDALYVDECKVILTRKLKQLKKIAQSSEKMNKNHSSFFSQINFYLDTNNYFNYFDLLWDQAGLKVTTVGDITPSYSALPVEGLKEIKAGLESRGFTVKVVFLMRDPIERCWSAVQMNRRNQLKKNETKILNNEQNLLENCYKSRRFEIRTRYEFTINNLESVFSPENIFYGFYETLFEDRTLNDIKSYLNLNDFSPNIEQKVNASEKNEQELKEKLARKIFDFYEETYRFCDNKFGVRELWSGGKYL